MLVPLGVGNKPEPVAPVRSPDGTSRDNGRPAGVADAFQISEHSVEPVLANRRRNLLSHEDSGPSGTGEPEKVGPQVPIVSLGFAFARDGERLAGWAAGPQLALVRPPGKPGCECPPTDPGEEMALGETGKIGRRYIHDGTFIYFPVRDQARGDEVAQPLGCIRFELVVVGRHRIGPRISNNLACRSPSMSPTLARVP